MVKYHNLEILYERVKIQNRELKRQAISALESSTSASASDSSTSVNPHLGPRTRSSSRLAARNTFMGRDSTPYDPPSAEELAMSRKFRSVILSTNVTPVHASPIPMNSPVHYLRGRHSQHSNRSRTLSQELESGFVNALTVTINNESARPSTSGAPLSSPQPSTEAMERGESPFKIRRLFTF